MRTFAVEPAREPARDVVFVPPPEYQPGVCNIGPDEIRRRRNVGHTGLTATVGLLGALLWLDAPPVSRLIVALPAMISASGYLQAALRFCAGYGARGLLNFGPAGQPVAVPDEAAAAADRRKARQISLASFAIGAAVAVVGLVLPR
jgi:hypothetical protein